MAGYAPGLRPNTGRLPLGYDWSKPAWPEDWMVAEADQFGEDLRSKLRPPLGQRRLLSLQIE